MKVDNNLFILLFLIYVANIADGQGPLVNTTLGLVRGIITTDGEVSMHEYLGIPYAKVNEDNPFGPAIPHPVFDEIFDANDDSAICPQQEVFNHTIVGTLDCLHLNVHVPSSVNSTSRLPVFVWIYGGGFEVGFFGRYLQGAKFLVRHDIVVVSLNYRTGPYGFMCLDTPEVPGNQGLKDQLSALRWIRDNIEAFGGDPDKITIAGNSAGAISVEYHIMHQKEGPRLFHKAIIQSGTTLMPMSYNSVKDAPLLFAQQLGYETSNITEAIAFLAKKDPHLIIATNYELNLGSFGPCIEQVIEGEDAFITENWSLLSELPGAKDLPVLIGFTEEEFWAFTETSSPAVVNYILSSIFDTRHEDFQSLAESVKHFYFGDEDIDNDVLQATIDLGSDVLFAHSMLRSVARFLDNDVGNMYLYMFSYEGGRNFVKIKENITIGGATHSDELGYLFDILYMEEEPSPEDQRVIEYMTAMWANFVKYGDPTPQTTQLLPQKWLPITKDSPYHYMNIDLTLSVGARPLHERMTFWDLIYETYGHLELAMRTPNDELRKLLRNINFH